MNIDESIMSELFKIISHMMYKMNAWTYYIYVELNASRLNKKLQYRPGGPRYAWKRTSPQEAWSKSSHKARRRTEEEKNNRYTLEKF